MLSKENVQAIYKMAPMQEGMLVHFARHQQASAAYVEQFDFHTAGPLHLATLEKAFNALLRKYAVLRTIFSYRRTDTPKQIVLKERRAVVSMEDYSLVSEPMQSARVELFKVQDRERGFDLSTDLLLRLTVLKTGVEAHRLILTFHHIILDGWCLGLLFEDLFTCYERLLDQPGLVLSATERIPYGHYLTWLNQQDRTRAAAFWETYLADYTEPAGPPFFDRAVEGPAEHAVHRFSLGGEMTDRLTALAKSSEVTVNRLFQTVWGLLLQKYQRTDDVVFGSVVSGRPPSLAGVEEIVGLFINTQALRVRTQPGDTVLQLARRLHQQNLEAVAYEYYGLTQIQSHSPLKNRLINHVVAFENYPISERMRQLGAGGAGLRVIDVEVVEQSDYAFDVIVNPGADLKVSFIFNRRHYSDEVIAGLERSLRHLFAQVVAQPESEVRSLTLCSPVDRMQILDTFNATHRPYPSDKSVVELFEETVAAYPTATALRFYETAYTYAELRARVQAIAATLQHQGVQPGDRVGLFVDRRPELIFGLLGILYCGAGYIPLDLHSPPQRLAFMAADSEIRLVCTVGSFRAQLPNDLTVLVLDEPTAPATAGPFSAATIDPAKTAAYIMYTSGSTGAPKACAVSHRNIVRLVKGNDFAPFGPQHRLLLTAAPVFDPTTFEIWSMLLHGGELCLAREQDIIDAARLKALLQSQRITMMQLVSALFNQLCDADPTLFAPLQFLMVGGDFLSPSHVARLRQANPGIILVNGYGPTENTTVSTTYSVRDDISGRIPIGSPIRNSTAYIVDAELRLLPVGAYGELVVGGDGVALGYLNRPALTAERFISDPFSASPDARLYRTGDIARWLPDGNLDLRGRMDFQIKIRGFRVELPEIEQALGAIPQIREAVVRVHENGPNKQLHAYYVAESPVSAAELRNALMKRLPGYMIPSHFQAMERMPLTTHGKVDRQALPPMIAPVLAAAPAEPRGALERQVAGIVREVLGRDQVGLHDNFFEAGADSLSLMTIDNRLKLALGRDVPLSALFEHTSIAALAEFLGQDGADEERKVQEEVRETEAARSSLRKTKLLIQAADED